MKRSASLILGLLVITSSLADIPTAFQDYFSGQYAAAQPRLQELAGKRNAEASFYLGMMAMNGYGTGRNIAEGITRTAEAANLNYLPAILYLGQYYFQQKNLDAAYPWMKKAADAGSTNAALFVAITSFNGYGTKRNTETARRAIVEGAKGGIPMAEYQLAIRFLNSKHSGENRIGKVWIMKAAEEGYVDAQYALGMMLLTGDKIDKDPTKGTQWLNQASAHGSVAAQTALKNGAQTPSPEFSILAQLKEQENSTPANLSPQAQWEFVVNTLQKAHLVLANPVVPTANPGQVTVTPQLVEINKNNLIKPDYRLITAENIPLSEVILYAMKTRFQQEKQPMIIPEDPFQRPAAAHDDSEAFALLSSQETYGYPQTLYQLGQQYEAGLGTSKDLKKAQALYAKSADQNYSPAQYKMGIIELQNTAETHHIDNAIHWLTLAALQGNPNAQLVLAEVNVDKIKKETDPKVQLKAAEEARSLFNLCTSHGFGVASYRLGLLSAAGIFNPSHQEPFLQEDQNEALKLFTQAYAQKVPGADLALAYLEARQNQSDERQDWIFDTAKKAMSNDDPSGTLLLAVLYERGIGARKNESKAMGLLESLKDDHNPMTQLMLAMGYLSKGDSEKGRSLLEKLANDGNGYAQYNLALLAREGRYHPTNETFQTLLAKAAANHFDRASLLLADDYLSVGNDPKQIKTAFDLYQALANKQNATAQLKLGFMYENGLGTSQNKAKALEWYQKAAENNDPIAAFLLGYLYQTGKGVDRDVTKAIHYYQQAANESYAPAQINLGVLYETEQHDYAKAKELYSLSENPVALYNLAILYQYGKGVEADSDKALDLYHQAAKLGFNPVKTAILSLRKTFQRHTHRWRFVF